MEVKQFEIQILDVYRVQIAFRLLAECLSRSSRLLNERGKGHVRIRANTGGKRSTRFRRPIEISLPSAFRASLPAKRHDASALSDTNANPGTTTGVPAKDADEPKTSDCQNAFTDSFGTPVKGTDR
jgi:hypothetical protein